MHSRVSIIAAIDEKRGLGKNNELLFKIPRDFKRLRELINGHPLVMGRKTFASFGRRLPNKSHIVITHDPKSLDALSYEPDAIVSSVAEGIEAAKKFPGAEEIFIFGGGQIFTEAVEQDLVDRLYMTLVKGDYGADVFFPDYSKYKTVINEEHFTEDGFEFTFLDLER